MKRYEICIKTTQPPCGGKSPTRSEILELDVEDPVQFVRERETGLPLDASRNEDGDIVISGAKDKYQVSYTFTEI